MAKRQYALDPSVPATSQARQIVDFVKKLKGFDESLSLGEDGPMDSVIRSWISTQIATLDYAIRRPGVPTGRITVFVGLEGSAKSTVVDHLLAETQAQAGIAVIVDAENGRDAERMARMGIDMDNIIIIKPHLLEPAFRAIEKLIKRAKEEFPDTLMCIVVDSLAGLVSEGAMEKEIGESNVALAARAMSQQILPRMADLIGGTNIALVLVNQLRTYIAPFNGPQRSQERRKVMGNKSMTSEAALVYWASLVIYTSTTGDVGEDKENPTGTQIRATLKKDRVGPGEHHVAAFNVDFLNGADIIGSKFDLMKELGYIKSGGGWYWVNENDKKWREDAWPAVYATDKDGWDKLCREAPLLWEMEDEPETNDNGVPDVEPGEGEAD